MSYVCPCKLEFEKFYNYKLCPGTQALCRRTQNIDRFESRCCWLTCIPPVPRSHLVCSHQHCVLVKSSTLSQPHWWSSGEENETLICCHRDGIQPEALKSAKFTLIFHVLMPSMMSYIKKDLLQAIGWPNTELIIWDLFWGALQLWLLLDLSKENAVIGWLLSAHTTAHLAGTKAIFIASTSSQALSLVQPWRHLNGKRTCLPTSSRWRYYTARRLVKATVP